MKVKAKLLMNYLDFAFFSILQGGHLKLGIHFFQSWIFFSFVLRGILLFIVMKKYFYEEVLGIYNYDFISLSDIW